MTVLLRYVDDSFLCNLYLESLSISFATDDWFLITNIRWGDIVAHISRPAELTILNKVDFDKPIFLASCLIETAVGVI